MMDKEGIIVEVDGFEQVKVKGSTKEMKAGIFPVRTPRALVGRNVDSGGIFTKEDLELTSSTTLAFKIALPVKLSSSYVCEYETHEVRVEYVLKAETTLEGVKVTTSVPVFLL